LMTSTPVTPATHSELVVLSKDTISDRNAPPV
jgi:hypothetical protein